MKPALFSVVIDFGTIGPDSEQKSIELSILQFRRGGGPGKIFLGLTIFTARRDLETATASGSTNIPPSPHSLVAMPL
jgi:hypothetical protein